MIERFGSDLRIFSNNRTFVGQRTDHIQITINQIDFAIGANGQITA